MPKSDVMPVAEHEAEVARLRDAIQDHRMAIRDAGEVRVDSRDAPIADEKHRADERLWSVLDALTVGDWLSCSCLACDCQLYNALKSERNRYRTALREICRPLAPQAANALAHGYQQIAKEALNG